MSLILVCLTAILIASGWRELLAPTVSDRGVLLFLVGWVLLSRFQLPVSTNPPFEIGLSLIPAFYVAIRGFSGESARLKRLQLTAVGLFLASLYALHRHIAQADPLLLPFHSQLSGAVLIGGLAAFLVRETDEQLGAVSLGIGLGVVLALGAKPQPRLWGGPDFQDVWWTSIAAARLVSLASDSIWAASRGIATRVKGRSGRSDNHREE